ncbi:unnamed protein product [Pieris macdunnoughi]|uniref:Uncharacterized protein n=1 Tax=Pieris macdunnoughi TaxID=345717 RepID=A0A821X6I7_9NEOP|nr:unnamed protein product [Pieris macdunnoughi]
MPSFVVLWHTVESEKQSAILQRIADYCDADARVASNGTKWHEVALRERSGSSVSTHSLRLQSQDARTIFTSARLYFTGRFAARQQSLTLLTQRSMKFFFLFVWVPSSSGGEVSSGTPSRLRLWRARGVGPSAGLPALVGLGAESRDFLTDDRRLRCGLKSVLLLAML